MYAFSKELSNCNNDHIAREAQSAYCPGPSQKLGGFDPGEQPLMGLGRCKKLKKFYFSKLFIAIIQK